MKIEQPHTEIFTPDISLGAWIESHIILIHRGGIKQEQLPWTIMPDCSGYLIFHLLKDRSRLSVVGPRSVFKNINRKGRLTTLIVKFRPGGLAALLPFPVSELRDCSLPAEFILGSQAGRLKNRLDKLARAERFNECITAIERFLSDKLKVAGKRHSFLNSIIQQIDQKAGSVGIKELAHKTGISGRYLRKIFSEKVGLGPKRFTMISRVTNIVKKVDDGIAESWAELALDADYYDQSHLIEDFNLLLGESPEAFIGRANREEIL